MNLEICLSLPREAIALLRSALPLPECGHADTLAEGFDGEEVIESNVRRSTQHKPFTFAVSCAASLIYCTIAVCCDPL